MKPLLSFYGIDNARQYFVPTKNINCLHIGWKDPENIQYYIEIQGGSIEIPRETFQWLQNELSATTPKENT